LPVSFEAQVTSNPVEEAQKQAHALLEEIARLSERDLEPADYYGEFLKRVLPAVGGSAGAIWGRTGQGHVHLHYQVNLESVGLDSTAVGRKSHEELLRQAFSQARPLYLPPHSSPGTSEGEKPKAGNPTASVILLVPVVVDREVVGLLEVWQSPTFPPSTVNVHVQFLVRMASLASAYLRNHQRREVIGQQRLWTHLETFARHIHSSLSPAEVAYTIVNEARRLVGCDRISVAMRRGRRTAVEAISGADVIEKRSNLVQQMRLLFRRVLAWGDTLVYTGTRDSSLPPPVLKALDAYLAESNSKLLVILPLRDEREVAIKRRPRSALMMECFDPNAAPEQLVAQLEVVGRHAATALYNAAEYRRIPLRWLWQPLALVQEGIGGKAVALGLLMIAAVAGIVAALVGLPYPLKMDAQGQLLPQERCWIYSPVEGQVVRFAEGVQPGKAVSENQSLVLMYDVALELKLVQLNGEIAGAEQDIAALARQQAAALTVTERLRFGAAKKQKEYLRDRKILERAALRERTHSDEARPGHFWLKAPLGGTVLNWDFHENLTNRYVKPAEPLLRIGDKEKYWEVELKIPQKHIGQVLQAFDTAEGDAELDVDLLLLSCPTQTFKGRLARSRIAGEASPNRDNPSDSEPVVLASVRLEGPGIEDAERVPPDLLVTGTEVHSRIRCGDRPMGYSLFYGLWEFFYEKVAFHFLTQ
jgi:hypothetical protein